MRGSLPGTSRACQEGGADLEEGHGTQGGKGEAVELLSVVPKKAETEQPCSSLAYPGPRRMSELPLTPRN